MMAKLSLYLRDDVGSDFGRGALVEHLPLFLIFLLLLFITATVELWMIF